uniref:DNA polymerase delta subunit 3 n=1 Tax=Steinernema glaseri TaxID=37863 RepID=A0A1I7Z231_9BILA
MSSKNSFIQAQFKARRGPSKKSAGKKDPVKAEATFTVESLPPPSTSGSAEEPKKVAPLVIKKVAPIKIKKVVPEAVRKTPLKTLQPNVRSPPSPAPASAAPPMTAEGIVQTIQRSTNAKANSALLMDLLSLDLSAQQVEDLNLVQLIGSWKSRQRVFHPVAVAVLSRINTLESRIPKRKVEVPAMKVEERKVEKRPYVRRGENSDQGQKKTAVRPRAAPIPKKVVPSPSAHIAPPSLKPTAKESKEMWAQAHKEGLNLSEDSSSDSEDDEPPRKAKASAPSNRQMTFQDLQLSESSSDSSSDSEESDSESD